MLDLNLTVSIAVGFNSMIAGITPVQSQPCVDATRWWSMHGMHCKSGCPAVRLLLIRSAARAFCRYCGIGSYALLKKCVPKLLALLDCEHLRTPCFTSIPADTRSSKSRSDLAGQALHCACRTACIQIMSVGSVSAIKVALIHPMIFWTAQLSAESKQYLPHPCLASGLQHAHGSCKSYRSMQYH